MPPSQAHESFRGLLLSHRGRTGLIQRDLASRAGVSERSIQDWEAGVTSPTVARLQALMRALLEAHGFTTGREASEARELWTAAERDARRMHTAFDEEWFARLLAAHTSPTVANPTDALQTLRATEQRTGTIDRAQDWGEAPDTLGFVGRSDELELLRHWVLEERCRLVAVLGFGGIGKTSLAAMLAERVVSAFERVYWRSLRNAPPVTEWLAGAIGFLSDQQLVPSPSESERITALVQLLRAKRCLLVLDNSEALFEPGQREGRYRPGMDAYGQLLQAVGETSHRSCLVLTSREAPPELAVLGSGVRVLELHGLGTADGQALLADKQLNGDTQAWVSLVDRYGGNGLALKIVGETIRQVYDGDIAVFIADRIATVGSTFGGIRRLLDAHVERLTPVERDVLTRLAVSREPIGLAELSMDVAPSVDRSALVDAIETLRQRSLVERGERAGTFTLQSMVLEYMTDRLVETAADEISRGQTGLLVEQPLIKAQAKDYVRQAQERLIGAPILRRLNAQHIETATDAQLRALLESWRGRPDAEQGYGPGNIVNLLRLHRGDLRGVDLSHLYIRQAYLQEVQAQDASLESAHLADAVLAGAFSRPINVALSADGRFLAIGTTGGDVGVWRVADRTSLLAVRAHAGLSHVALSGDGRFLATASSDGSLKLWETQTGRNLATLPNHAGAVWSVTLSADGRLLASASSDGVLKLWALTDTTSNEVVPTERLLTTTPGHSGPVHVTLSADGGWLARASYEGTTTLWQTDSGQSVAVLEGHAGPVTAAALSGDGRLLATGGSDGTIKLWEVPGGRLLASEQLQLGVRCVALSGDGRLLASAGFDGIARMWSVITESEAESTTVQLEATLYGSAGSVHLALSADGQLLASADTDGTAKLWEAPAGRLLTVLQGQTSAVWAVALSSDGQVMASGSADGLLRLWNQSTPGPSQTLVAHASTTYDVALSGDGRLLASCSWDGTAKLFDASSGRLLATLAAHTGPVWGVDLTEDGTLLATSSTDGTVKLWECPRGRLLATIQAHSSPLYCVALTADGLFLAAGGVDGTAMVWERSSRQRLATLEGHTGPVHGVALSNDARLAATGSTDGSARMWDARSGHLLRTLVGHSAPVYCVALSGDGSVLATGSADGTIRLWDSASGRPVGTLLGHSGAVRGLALSRNGDRLISGSYDGTARLWSVSAGACLRTFTIERQYERLEVTGLTGITEAELQSMIALGATHQTTLAGAARST